MLILIQGHSAAGACQNTVETVEEKRLIDLVNIDTYSFVIFLFYVYIFQLQMYT